LQNGVLTAVQHVTKAKRFYGMRRQRKGKLQKMPYHISNKSDDLRK
jgi:hypothetical protein